MFMLCVCVLERPCPAPNSWVWGQLPSWSSPHLYLINLSGMVWRLWHNSHTHCAWTWFRLLSKPCYHLFRLTLQSRNHAVEFPGHPSHTTTRRWWCLILLLSPVFWVPQLWSKPANSVRILIWHQWCVVFFFTWTMLRSERKCITPQTPSTFISTIIR